MSVHAKDQNLLQDMRSCNGVIIAGPDQSLPAQIEFSIKHKSSLLHLCGYLPLIQKISILFTYLNTLQDSLHILHLKNQEKYCRKKALKSTVL